jgi:hypothetical protein
MQASFSGLLSGVALAGALSGLSWCHAAPSVQAAPAVPPAKVQSLDHLDVSAWQVGGVTSDERKLMQGQSAQYTVWLLTAVRQSGEYLSDVHVTVRDQQDRIVFDQLLDGPWLMMKLPDGDYDVVATYNGERLRRHLKLHKGRQQKVYLHFGA